MRDSDADEGGRFGWLLPLDAGGEARVLMPGVELTRIRDDLSSQAPCLKINGNWSWWSGAVGDAIPLEPGKYTG